MVVHAPLTPDSSAAGHGGEADPLLALADRCVQCGLCLPHCPTYRLDRSEAESPRGRIAMARGLASGLIPPSPTADTHLDHCLGCRRCESACPAGVAYAELLVETRRRQRQRRPPPWRQRATEWLTQRPALLDRLLGAYRGLYGLLPPTLRRLPRPPAGAGTPAPADTGVPALFVGCVGRRYEAPTQAALGRLCQALGTALSVPAAQTCCGALHAHAGDTGTARALAARNAAAFAGGGPALTCASGCHEAVASALGPRLAVQDALVWLAERAGSLRLRPSRESRVALHLPCTQRRMAASVAATRHLLAAIPGLEVVELPDTGCCGAAGSHMLLFPDRATALRQPLDEALTAFGATTLLSANVGCRLHLERPGLRVTHPLVFLAEHLE